MRRSSIYAALALLLLYSPLFISARHISRSHSRGHNGHSDIREVKSWKDGSSEVAKQRMMNWEAAGRKHRRGPDTMQVAGSRLPDCSHACGSCTPCRLVMVSFVCATIAEAESCPMAYKCMCHNKSYPVP